MLHFGAEINHDIEPGAIGFFDGFFVYDAELEPDCLCSRCNRIVDDFEAIFRLAKHVHEIRRAMFGCVLCDGGVGFCAIGVTGTTLYPCSRR